jgi:hypothetical protein
VPNGLFCNYPLYLGKKSASGELIQKSLSDELGNLDMDSDDDEMPKNRASLVKEKIVPEVNIPKPIVSNKDVPTVKVETEVNDERSISNFQKSSSERLEVLKTFLDKDFIFTPADSSSPSNEQIMGFTNTKWLAECCSRNLIACGVVYVFEKANYFWQSDQFVPKTLAVYSDLLIIGREPKNAAEIRSSLSDPNQTDIFAGMTDNELMESFLIAENVIDFKTSKLRRSCLTTPSSVEVVSEDLANDEQNAELRKICFEVISPSQSFLISAVNVNDGNKNYTEDNRALFLTTQWEEAIKDALCTLHAELRAINDGDKSWVHQIILGTLHSNVVSGNYSLIEKAVMGKGSQISPYPGIDSVDEDGLTALHHACYRRSNTVVAVLLNAGADCAKATLKGRNTPCHISAKQLDAKSLSMILSQSQPSRPDPNALNENGHTPMTVAIIDGRAPGGSRNPTSLNMCVASLQAWGGQLHVPYSPHPVHTLSSEWCHEELEIVFPICDSKLPAIGNGMDGYGKSLAALLDYPLHACVIQLREKISKIGNSRVFPVQNSTNESPIVR